MKSNSLLICLFGLGLLAGCKSEPKQEANAAPAVDSAAQAAAPAPAAATPAGAPYTVSTGTVNWEATKKIGSGHKGTINVSGGELYVDNGMLTGGKVTLDLNSFTATDLKGDKKTDFDGHMKSPDFFDTGKYPTAELTITKVVKLDGRTDANAIINGDLNLHGVTKPVNFTAMVKVEGNKLMASAAKFNINRTDWDMKYSSALLGTAPDKIINDEVSLSLNIEAMGK